MTISVAASAFGPVLVSALETLPDADSSAQAQTGLPEQPVDTGTGGLDAPETLPSSETQLVEGQELIAWTDADGSAWQSMGGSAAIVEIADGLAQFRATGSPVAISPAFDGSSDLLAGGDTGAEADWQGFAMCGCGLCGGGTQRSLSAEFDIDTASGPGRAALVRDIDPGTEVRFTGDRNVDATLIGSKWTITEITFSFPTSGSFYGPNYKDGEATAQNFQAFNAMQQDAVRYALGLIGQYTNLTFTEVTESASTHATLRFGQTHLDSVGSAYANFPGLQPFAGDVWFGTTGQPFYDTPAVGNWGMATMMHEIGHAMGLKHGHQDYASFDLTDVDGYNYFAGLLPDGSGRNGTHALEDQFDGQSFSLMTYDAAPGVGGDFYGDGFNQPQTYQMFDIAALQFLYGANYRTNSGNTVYTFDPETGQMFVNGQAQAAADANIILRTLWDGGGNDTLDLSNYDTDMVIDLRPGAYSTFDFAQLADHNALNGGGAPAEGNLALARLVKGDLRGLIENAIGGTGDDIITGNQGANLLIGGDEVLRRVYVGPGRLVDAKTAGNTTIQSATSLDGLFGQAYDPEVEDSEMPHVSIAGTGNGNASKFYSFTILEGGTTVLFDIDHGYTYGTPGSFDTYITVYDSLGRQVASNDDGGLFDEGSESSYDSYLNVAFGAAGTYYVAVSGLSYWGGVGPIPNNGTYELQVTVQGPVVAPTGLVGGDTLNGLGGNDVIMGEGGADVMNGGTGIDTLSYASDTRGVSIRLYDGFAQGGDAAGDRFTGFENVAGGSGRDSLIGDANANVLSGGGNDDVLNGLAGNDTLLGGAGNDRLIGGAGGDSLNGGAGIDTADYAADTKGVTLYLFNGYAAGGFAAGDQVAEVENVIGGSGNDVLLGNDGTNVLTGGNGIDFLSGLGGADTLIGGAGNDTLLGGAGADSLSGGIGIDTLSYTADRAGVRVQLNNGIAQGGEAQGDRFTAVENVLGGLGNDTLVGNNQSNFLVGSGGNDTLNGLGGNDRLAGGVGADTFVFQNGFGDDIVNDFSLSQAGERISLAAVTAITGWADLVAHHLSSTVEGFALITDGDDTITLRNVVATALTADDFLF